MRRYFVLSVFILNSAAFGAEYIVSEQVAPEGVEELKSPMGIALNPGDSEKLELESDRPDDSVDTRPQWLREMSIGFNLRGYSFKRVNQDDSINQATAIGGELSLVTGTFANIARLGLSHYSSFGLDAPLDKGGSGLLGKDEEDLSVLGQSYLQLGDLEKFGGRVYRHALNLPYINKDDGRMIPNTHEAYIGGRVNTGRDFVFGHISDIKKKDSEEFISMSEAAGATGSDKGVNIAGFYFGLANDTTIGALYLNGDDTFNTGYVEGAWKSRILRQFDTKAGAQFTSQRSTGDELVGKFDTDSFGLSLASGVASGMILRLAYTQTDKGGSIRSPWGGAPSYNSMMLESFDRAGEKSFRVGFSWSGSQWGQEAWSGIVKIVSGWDAVDAGSGARLPNEIEYNITMDFKPVSSVTRPVWLRLRGAYADFNDDTDRWNIRVILNYPVNIL